MRSTPQRQKQRRRARQETTKEKQARKLTPSQKEKLRKEEATTRCTERKAHEGRFPEAARTPEVKLQTNAEENGQQGK